MSQGQLDQVIKDVVAVFGAFGPSTTLDEMRKAWDGIFADVKPTVGAKSTAVDAGGVRAEWIEAPEAETDRVVLYFHGGGYVLGSIDSHRDLCERVSRAAKARVLALDYRLAPENPFPAAVDDATAAYRWLLAQGVSPKKIAIAGDSAGGGLTFACLLALKQQKQPMPACATPLSPWVDLEGLGGTMASKAEVDPMVQKAMIAQMGSTYAGKDLRNPLAAPLYGDLTGLPPLLIQVGGRETLLDDARRMAEKAKESGVECTVDVWDAQIHVWQIFASRLDEGEEAIQKLGQFIRKHTA